MKDKNDSAAAPGAETRERLCIVGIGASAGGLEAIREMLSTATAKSNLAYVVVQHLDPNHESLLAELLGRHTELNVLQVSGGEKIEADNVYIIPPGHGLSVTDGTLQLTDFAQPRGLRRPIDDFFESLALDQGRFAACVILSGTGADGSAGLRAIKEHGGLCLVQSPETAKYDGMPTSAQSTGLVDFVRSPDRIISAIQQFYAHSLSDKVDEKLTRTVEQMIQDICAVVRTTVGHDFSGYKKSTLVRRVQRRIQVLDLPDANAYLRCIKADPDECEILFRELLINVTRFFRDTEQFEMLRDEAIRPLVRNADNKDEIRVWVPGCSSGEEAYSIAMMFAHEVRLQRRAVNIQIFATDIDEQMLRIARDGVYPQSALADIPEGMRDLYTVARDGKFRVSNTIRDMVRFSIHSIVRDPPFSNIDLLSCRNLLIYFGDKLQKSAFPTFHYAIRPGGTLFLGPSETVGRFEHLFAPIEPGARVFRRNNARPEYPQHLRGQIFTETAVPRRPARDQDEATRVGWSDAGVAERVLERYAPPTLQVSTKGDILKSTGKLGKYLDLAPGQSQSQTAAAVARPGAREAISAIIRQVAQSRRRSITRDLTAQSEFGRQPFDLIADPLNDGTLLLVFRDRDRFEALDDADFEEVDPSDSHVQSLEDELRTTRARLHVTVEELETANEELKSSNEEMMSMNEELQSTNEELSTVNDELKGKVDELSVANADLSNFFASTALPLLVVDARMNIRNFTDAIEVIYRFRNADRGRPLPEVTSTLHRDQEVLAAIEKVVATGDPHHMRVRDRVEGRTWALVVTPYRMRDGAVDGATLVFTEVTEALRLEDALKHEGERLRLALDVAEQGIWEFNYDSSTLVLDDMGCRLMGIEDATLSIRGLLAAIAPHDRAAVETALRMEDDSPPGQIDLTLQLAGDPAHARSVQIVGRRLDGNRTSRVLGVIFDVTEEQESKRIREMMLREMNHRVKNMFSIISGMIRIAGRQTSSVDELVRGISDRITALARSHDLTQRAPSSQQLALKDAVAASLEPYSATTAIFIDGPPVPVSSQDLTALSLLLHEWATNAAKYGVLGPVEGRLEVTWERLDENKVRLSWNEIYLGHVEPHEGQSGFGSTLVQLSASQLQGDVTVDTDGQQRRTILTYVPQS
ncbi:chemotaxis protein CheB [Roseivivax sp. CAU 1753]